MLKTTTIATLKKRRAHKHKVTSKSLYEYLKNKDRIQIEYRDFKFLIARINEIMFDFAVDGHSVVYPYLATISVVEENCKFVFNKDSINVFATTYPVDEKATKKIRENNKSGYSFNTNVDTIRRIRLKYRPFRNRSMYRLKFHTIIKQKLKNGIY